MMQAYLTCLKEFNTYKTETKNMCFLVKNKFNLLIKMVIY